jgi:ankyrin repeat protein
MKNKIDDTIQSAQTSEAIQSTQTNEKSSSASDLFINGVKQKINRFQQMSKIKRFLIFCAIGFTASITLQVYDKLNYYQPLIKTKIDEAKAGSSAEVKINLNSSGCYEVGLGSYDCKLGGDAFKEDGEYKIEYFDSEGNLIEEKTVFKTIATSLYTRTTYTNAVLDVVKIPLQGKHRDIKIKLTIIKPNSSFDPDKHRLYLYVDKTEFLSCGKARDEELKKAALDKYLKNIKIDAPPEDETLKPLFEALWNKDLKTIQKLIPNEFGVDTEIIAGRAPLHYAAYLDDLKTAKYLLSLGADIDKRDFKEAFDDEHWSRRLSKPYYALGFHPGNGDGRTPIFYATDNNATNVVKLLMESDANVSLSDYDKGGVGLLFLSGCKEHYEIFEYLLESPKIDKTQMIPTSWSIFALLGADYVDKPAEGWDYGLCPRTSSEVAYNRANKARALLDKYGVTPTKPAPLKSDRPVKQRGFWNR